MESLETFYNNNSEITIAIVAAIIIAFIWKPRAIGKIVGAIAIIAVVGYLIVELTNITGSAIHKKDEAANRTDKEFHNSGT